MKVVQQPEMTKTCCSQYIPFARTHIKDRRHTIFMLIWGCYSQLKLKNMQERKIDGSQCQRLAANLRRIKQAKLQTCS